MFICIRFPQIWYWLIELDRITFLKSQMSKKIVLKRVYGDVKILFPWDSQKVSWVALLYTTNNSTKFETKKILN